MTVRQHLEYFLWWHQSNKKKFKTHDIQDLSVRGVEKWGYRLGSPGTYTRQFRYLKKDLYTIDKLKLSNSNEASWSVRRKND